MKIYYCDGSQSDSLGKLGVGVVSDNISQYFEYTDFIWKEQTHEIVAITKTIEVALMNKTSPIIIVNDSIHLPITIEKELSKKKRKLENKIKYRELIDLVEKYSVKIRKPENQAERKEIKKAHNLSRTYIDLNLQSREK